ncbi:MAG TPA: endonuclease/exonuclease/phosphatase family protein [Longimicrobium sp.]|nr:endonuclease/exonuclease/phosphatase family protein [Longimicrobium sp.]
MLIPTLVVAAGLLAVAGTLLSFSRSPHWGIRIWDFPRVQVALLAGASAAVYAAFFFRGRPLQWAFLAATLLSVARQVRKIFPYTPLARVQVERSRKPPHERVGFRLLISNVLMENTRHELLLERIRESDPDLVLAVETDARWDAALAPLEADYPYVVRQPQENYYGMVLYSRLPLIGPRVDFLVQDDIPSVHTAFELPGGVRVFLHGVHPRPPEPIRDQDSTPRDAELVVLGRAIGETEDRPTVVAGDLNDVAWSRSSELFLRLSGLLDPRVGRGFYNSYNAKNPLFRYPLDHVFHSADFRLVEIRRCASVGSDHFPMLLELSYEPAARADQPEPPLDPDDVEEAEEILEKEAEAAQTGDDRPGRGE